MYLTGSCGVVLSCVVFLLLAYLRIIIHRHIHYIHSLPPFSLFGALSPCWWYKIISLLFECVKTCYTRSCRYALFTGLRFVAPVLPVLPVLFGGLSLPVILCRSYWLLLLRCYCGHCLCILLHCVSSCVLRSLFIVHPFTHTYTHTDTRTPPHPGTPTPLRSLSIHIITPHTPLIHKNNSQNSMVKNEKSFCKNSLLTIK